MEGFTPEEERKLWLVRFHHQAEHIGYCYLCGDWVLRRDVRQEERDECCVYVCRRDGSIIDPSPAFS